MSNQYIYFTTVIGNEALLKEEIRIFFPDFKLSYSQKGLVTFKNTGSLETTKSLSRLNPTFTLAYGIFEQKSNLEGLSKLVDDITAKYEIDSSKLKIHTFSLKKDILEDSKATSALPKSISLDRKNINKTASDLDTIIDIIETREDEFWVGTRYANKYSLKYPNANPQINLPSESPSRAYLKIAEAQKLFHIDINNNDAWIEYGSAPGGASYFLLQRGCEVYGVDPAEMASVCINNHKFKHLKKPMQDLSQENLPDQNIDWVLVDVNLNPKQAIKEALRLSKKHAQNLKGIIFTIKVIKIDHVKNIQRYKNAFNEFGMRFVRSYQLPSDKKEFVILAVN